MGGCYTFPKDISPKVNVIVQIEFELTYLKTAVHYFSHYTIETLPPTIINKLISYIYRERDRDREGFIYVFIEREFYLSIYLHTYI